MPIEDGKLAVRRPPAGGAPVSATFLGLLAAMAVLAGGMLALPEHARSLVFPLVLVGWLVSLCLHEFGTPSSPTTAATAACAPRAT